MSRRSNINKTYLGGKMGILLLGIFFMPLTLTMDYEIILEENVTVDYCFGRGFRS